MIYHILDDTITKAQTPMTINSIPRPKVIDMFPIRSLNFHSRIPNSLMILLRLIQEYMQKEELYCLLIMLLQELLLILLEHKLK